MLRSPKRIVVRIHGGSGHWVVKFPDREIVARDRTMVRNLVRAYAKNHAVIASILWETGHGIDGE